MSASPTPTADATVDAASQQLLAAIESGSVEDAERLVKSSKGFNWAKKGVGSPLVIAIRKLSYPIVSLLLESGASPNYSYLDESLVGLQAEMRLVIPLHVAFGSSFNSSSSHLSSSSS